MFPDDTIAAISSAIAPAARIIVRLTGPQSLPITAALCQNESLDPNTAKQITLTFASLRCPAWIYAFHAPHSFTGGDMVEFHLPGNPLLARMFLDHLLSSGARLATPGEFTARSYFAGKIDLTAAEGIAATIAAANQDQLDAARELLAGQLASRLTPIMDSLADTLGLVEVGIDFSEEDITFLLTDDLRNRIQSIDRDLSQLLDESDRFEQLVHEPRFVLVGRPNAGKSTLINALAVHPRSIVSDIPGTTRYVLSNQIDLPHGPVQLIDIAGLEETRETGISEKAQQLAHRAIESADFVLLIQEVTDNRPTLPLPRSPDMTIFTKSDLRDRKPLAGEILVSAKSGSGLTNLKHTLNTLAFGSSHGATRLALNSRHVTALTAARSTLSNLLALPTTAPAEVIAMELREALDSLGQILGDVSPDDLLGRIFSRFCIGK